MTNAAAFRIYADAKLGGAAFDTESGAENAHLFKASLDTTLAHLAWTEGATNAKGEPFRIAAGFADIYEPNAHADLHEGCHVIAMNSALFVAITEFTMFCFAQETFFPDVGDAASEISPCPINHRPPGLWLLDYTKQGGRVETSHSDHLIPKCPDRYVTSIYLALLMARFVWMHELAHCFNGHLGLIRQRGLGLQLNEIARPSGLIESESADERAKATAFLHQIELDADRSALWSTMRIQSDNLENVEGISELVPDLRHRLMLFGAFAMTWLFEAFQTYLNSQTMLTHPAPGARLRQLINTARERLPGKIIDYSAVEAATLDSLRIISDATNDAYLKDGEIEQFQDSVERKKEREALFQALAGLEFRQR